MCVCAHARVHIRMHVHLAAHCQVNNLLGFLLGRLFWHDLDGVLLCGRQGPPPSGISLCIKTGFKRIKRKKEKETTWSGNSACSPREKYSLRSEPPSFCLTTSSSLSQGFLLESRSLVHGAEILTLTPVTPLSFPVTERECQAPRLLLPAQVPPSLTQTPQAHFCIATMQQEL